MKSFVTSLTLRQLSIVSEDDEFSVLDQLWRGLLRGVPGGGGGGGPACYCPSLSRTPVDATVAVRVGGHLVALQPVLAHCL